MTQLQMLLLLLGVHILGLVAVLVLMVPMLRNDDPGFDEDSDGSDDGWGNRPNVRPDPGRWPGGGIPLPDAEQSRVRLRGPGRLSELLPSHERRPAREPVRTPVPAGD